MRLERGESITRPNGDGRNEEECLTIQQIEKSIS